MSSNIIYLYLKTHNKTGYKYLGKTTQDPYAYRGSGLLWSRHLNKYGNDVTTEVLFSTNDKDEFKKVALKYSQSLNIVESQQFANMCPEEGQGGYTVYNNDRNSKISKALRGRKNTWIKKGLNFGKVVCIDSSGKTVSVTQEEFKTGEYVGMGKLTSGKPRRPKKPYTRTDKIVACPHCHKSGAKNVMTRYHFDNCKAIL